MTGLAIVAAFTLAYAMLAKRLSSTVVTAPMLFLGFGAAMAQSGLVPKHGAEQGLHLVAEITLIVLLFLDAAQIDLDALRRRHVWPVRMLTLGLPLMIAIGTLAAWPFLPGWPLAAAALVAAILAPTDAALGQAVVAHPAVPERVRRALTVESGLNDGLALPAVLLFASLAAYSMTPGDTNWLLFGIKQVTLGPLAGAVIGLAGGRMFLRAKQTGWSSDIHEGIGALALAALSYLAAVLIGGNGFISAFAAGLCFGNVIKGQCRFVYEFTEGEGQLLSWAAFFLLGLALVPDALGHLDGPMLALILISLLIVRPLAVWLSLTGSDAAPQTRLFFGWFGPRGLATALFALLIVERIDPVIADPVLHIAINAVWISALLHGVSAAPLATRFAALIETMGDCPEMEPIENSAKPLSVNE
jgi:NhaP-type Na+/H+ or K+/H+ antiporter